MYIPGTDPETQARFVEWPKIPRGQNETISISEKIDGTNACIIVDKMEDTGQLYISGVQSRKRLITPWDDNFGFANWVDTNSVDLLQLGEGYHYGEWAGEGIQKNHHNVVGRKLFLFNTARWNPDNPNRPDCCDVVPLLYEGPLHTDTIDLTMMSLERTAHQNGWTPEGVIVWFHRGRRYEKHTFKTPDGKWTS